LSCHPPKKKKKGEKGKLKLAKSSRIGGKPPPSVSKVRRKKEGRLYTFRTENKKGKT